MNDRNMEPYRYRPVLFFVLAYFFTWIFWIPAIFTPESISPILMLIGLFAPAVVSTVFINVSAEYPRLGRRRDECGPVV